MPAEAPDLAQILMSSANSFTVMYLKPPSDSGLSSRAGDACRKLFVDIHLLRDYKPALEMSNFVEDIERWATGDVIHAIDGSEEKFLDYCA